MKYTPAVALFLSTLTIIPSPARATIEWELRYPFRLFAQLDEKQAEYFKDYSKVKFDWGWRKQVYVDEQCSSDESEKKKVLCSEMRLGPKRLGLLRSEMSDAHIDNKRLADVFVTAGLRYDQVVRQHRRSFVLPALTDRQWDGKANDETHAPVWVWTTASVHAGKTCAWTVDGDTDVKPCQSRAAFWMRRGENSSKISLRVIENQLPEYSLSGPNTKIREMLIVGLGDSYASGEGNPDIPARLTSERDLNGIPLRVSGDHKDAAYWIDRNCHRSLLSAQARAAIQLAAENPKLEIAFLGLACSGAEVLEGLIEPYGGTIETSKAGRGDSRRSLRQMSQLNQAIMALCKEWIGPSSGEQPELHSPEFKRFTEAHDKWEEYKNAYGLERYFTARPSVPMLHCKKGLKRDIDAILLSIGGNDIGFSGVIMHAVKPHWSWERVKFWWAERLTSPQEARRKIETELMSKYSALASAFQAQLNLKYPNRVIISQYPDPSTGKDKKLCGASHGPVRAGLQWLPPYFEGSVDVDEMTSIRRDVVKPLNEMIARAPGTDRNWSTANTHLTEFEGHGWCAAAEVEQNYADTGSDPGKFDAYAATTRWFRTFNDSVLVQHQRTLEEEMVDQNSIVKSTLPPHVKGHGMFHPNALGAAAMADSYLVELRKRIPK